MRTLAAIETEVLSSHRRGEPWADLWPKIEADVVALQPWDHRSTSLPGKPMTSLGI